MIKEIKKILGKEADEELINLSINTAAEMIKNYCHVKKVPDGLHYTLIRMAADIYKNEYGSSEENQTVVSSLKEGDITVSEWKCYTLIKDFRDKRVLIYSSNRKLYLDAIRERPATVFFECERKAMNVFDEEMAIATVESFLLCTNAGKNRFSIDFKNMWQYYKGWPDIEMEKTVCGLKKLLELLETEKESFHQQNKVIAKGHTDKFIKIVKELIPEESTEI